MDQFDGNKALIGEGIAMNLYFALTQDFSDDQAAAIMSAITTVLAYYDEVHEFASLQIAEAIENEKHEQRDAGSNRSEHRERGRHSGFSFGELGGDWTS